MRIFSLVLILVFTFLLASCSNEELLPVVVETDVIPEQDSTLTESRTGRFFDLVTPEDSPHRTGRYIDLVDGDGLVEGRGGRWLDLTTGDNVMEGRGGRYLDLKEGSGMMEGISSRSFDLVEVYEVLERRSGRFVD